MSMPFMHCDNTNVEVRTAGFSQVKWVVSVYGCLFCLHVCLCAIIGQCPNRTLDFLELKSQVVVNFRVGARSGAQVCWKCSQGVLLTSEPSLQSPVSVFTCGLAWCSKC